MITVQKTITYSGDPDASPLKTILLVVQVPVYEYTAPNDGQPVTRRATSDVVTASAEQLLDATTYSVALAPNFIAGDDAQTLALAKEYISTVLDSGSATDLAVDALVRYLSDAGDELGRQSLSLLILPQVDPRADTRLSRLAPFVPAPVFLAVNREGFVDLQSRLGGAAAVGDGLLLGAIAILTGVTDTGPVWHDVAEEDFNRWIESQPSRVRVDASTIMSSIKATFGKLYDFPLTIPEIKALTVAGSLKIVRSDGVDPSAKDFLPFVLAAECVHSSQDAPLVRSFRFTEPVAVQASAAAFSLTDGRPILRNDLIDPVTVSVKGIDGSVIWSRAFHADDADLGHLEITVPLQGSVTLAPAPGEAEKAPSKRLRGQVLVFNKDCVLKDGLVLIKAKSAKDQPWHVVGAAGMDASGSFSIPYPYGTYVEAEALVSLAPNEPASLSIVSTDGNETISDDFLYLLLENPNCAAPPAAREDCHCSPDAEAARLPDYADLIGSDVYSQDIGGSCVNLSKPNRTINEFNYQAIVRNSDPDVANYVLNKIEVGLDAVDMSLAMALASSASALSSEAATAAAEANINLANTPNAATASIADALAAASAHALAVAQAMTQPAGAITMTSLSGAASHLDTLIGILDANTSLLERSDLADPPPAEEQILSAAGTLKTLVTLAIDSVGTSARYELTGGQTKTDRRPIDSDNPVEWQDAPESQPAQTTATLTYVGAAYAPDTRHGMKGFFLQPRADRPAPQPATLSQAVTIATGHILHYKAVLKADGYSLGDLIYSLPLAPGQKKEIVVFDASHTLIGAETQSITQNERLAMGLLDERDLTDQLAGGISESLRGSSSANTSGISAGFGTGGQGYGGTGAYGGSGSAVLGVAGGVANANSTANQDSARDVSQFFAEKLRQQIMQNAEGYRQLNASVVSTVQEGQRYGVTSEVVANHNHCHALTMLYFEVLRHFAVFQELSSVEECVFVPLLLTRFTTENIARWRDVLAPALLPLPSDTYLQPFTAMAGPGRGHPLIKAFDADQRIKTHYANVDFPAGSYDDEPIRFLKGQVLLRVDLPRPKTRYDRIKSLPVTTKTVTSQEVDLQATVKQSVLDAFAAGATAGLSTLFTGPPGTNVQYQTKETQVQVKQAIFDAFMTLDANYDTVPPEQCIRVVNFDPTSISFGPVVVPVSGLDFFQDGIADRDLWTRYAKLLGYSDVLSMLTYYFKGRLIAEWDDIFYNDIAPLVFHEIVKNLRLSEINADFTAEARYTGGERLIPLFLSGTTSKKRNQLPPQLTLSMNSADIRALGRAVTLNVETVDITYSTPHYSGLLYGGNVNNDLLDSSGAVLDIPENPDERRNPRREDRYLAAKLIEHLNSNLEYYNRVLWYRLDPERRFMLLDGFSIQIFKDDGTPVPGTSGMRSLASVVKNEMITIAGNSMVFPVAPGYKVSGSFVQPAADNGKAPVTLLDHYKPLTPAQPYRISVPSKGVFAEAVQGACNACEKIETERLQDWGRYPIGDDTTPIAPVAVPTPAVTDWQAAFKDFAAPIVNVQNAPAAPTPGQGLQELSTLLAASGVFKDITGLDANQQNVIRTYLSNQENAKAFGEMAKEMAMQSHNTQNSGKIMDAITTAKNSGAISQQDAGQLVKDHLQQQIDGGATTKAAAETAKQAATPSLSRAAVDAAARDKEVTASRADGEGNTETVSIKGGPTSATLAEVIGAVPKLKQTLINDCWAVTAAMMIGWKTNNSGISPADAVTRAGQRFLQMYLSDSGLKAQDTDDFALHSQMIAEPPANYRLEQYIDWVKTYGPVWITTDAAATSGLFSPHARVLTKIAGTGAPDGTGTEFTLIDPSTGTESTQPFLEFEKGFEQMVTDNHALTLTPQVLHFIEKVDKPVGFELEGPFGIHEPVHENITLAALMRSTVPVPAGVKRGSDQAVDEFLRGVIWNDDPAILMFNESASDNWSFTWGISWYAAFYAAGHATMNNVTNLTGRSHYWDMQFLHAMAAEPGEVPQDTLAKIMFWAEVMYRLAIAEGVTKTDKLADIHIASSVAGAGAMYSYSMASFFDQYSRPTGQDTIGYLLTQDTAFRGLDIGRRAIGSLLHVVQDSYARGHVRRTLTNPGDLKAGETDKFKPGTYGHYGEVENFHCYKGQDSSLHDKYDKPPWWSGVDATDLESFNALPGARDAIDASIKLLNMWRNGTAWAANSGPKELLEGTIFKLSANVSPADSTV